MHLEAIFAAAVFDSMRVNSLFGHESANLLLDIFRCNSLISGSAIFYPMSAQSHLDIKREPYFFDAYAAGSIVFEKYSLP